MKNVLNCLSVEGKNSSKCLGLVVKRSHFFFIKDGVSEDIIPTFFSLGVDN